MKASNCNQIKAHTENYGIHYMLVNYSEHETWPGVANIPIEKTDFPSLSM